jgi:hypothetical protein
MVLLHIFLRYLPGDPRSAHGKDLRVEMDIVEVPHNKHQKTQGRFKGMDYVGQIYHPLGKYHHKECLKPEHETGEAEKNDCKSGGKILDLLNATEPVETWSFLLNSQIVFDEGEAITQILFPEDHILKELMPSPGTHYRKGMIKKCGNKQKRRKAVDFAAEEHSAFQVHNPLSQPRFVVLESKARNGQYDKGRKEEYMDCPFRPGKTFDLISFFCHLFLS